MSNSATPVVQVAVDEPRFKGTFEVTLVSSKEWWLKGQARINGKQYNTITGHIATYRYANNEDSPIDVRDLRGYEEGSSISPAWTDNARFKTYDFVRKTLIPTLLGREDFLKHADFVHELVEIRGLENKARELLQQAAEAKEEALRRRELLPRPVVPDTTPIAV